MSLSIAILESVPAPAANIRNFSIIAHIDHGKSTLADRILEITGAVDARDHRPQLLDSMDLERERGITIKAQAVRVEYTARDGQLYRLHLIDTPGHVDFTYEVSRSLAACDGALLLVDATPGRRGPDGRQHLPGGRRRARADPGAEQDRPAGRRARTRGRRDRRAARRRPRRVIRISAKTGEGVTELLEAVVERVPRPEGDLDAPPARSSSTRSSTRYRGVVAYVRVVDGALRKGDRPARDADRHRGRGRRDRLLRPLDDAGRDAARRRGRLPDHRHQGRLAAARRRHAHRQGAPRAEPLPGYREVKPMVFCGLFPVDTDQFPDLARRAREALAERRRALLGARDVSQALGFGFRCGFLGLLHMDIVRERLEREYDLELLATTPERRVRGHAHRRHGADASTRPREHARPGHDRGDPRALHPGHDPVPEGARRRRDGALPGAPRHARRHDLPVRPSACSSTTTCRSPRSCSTSSTS